MALKIKIGKETYPIAFGYGAFRIMGRKWGCAGINETMKRLSLLDGIDENLTYDQEDIIADMILAGIELANAETDTVIALPSRAKAFEAVLLKPDLLPTIITELMQSFPQSGNVNPAKRAGAKKKK